MSVKSIKKGAILLARPSLSLDIFNRSIVIIAEHSNEGSLGFIINKPSRLPIHIFLSQINSNQIVFEGGPVQKEQIFYLHHRPDLITDSLHIQDNMYWSGNFDDLCNAISENIIDESEIKFCLGYCGWEANQLENELSNKEWEILDEENINVLNHWENDLWKNSLKKLGGENLIWLNTPLDPFMN